MNESEERETTPALVEVKKQLVALVFTVATVALVMAIQADPTKRRRALMRTALWVKRSSLIGADRLETLAAKASTVYNQNRNIPD